MEFYQVFWAIVIAVLLRDTFQSIVREAVREAMIHTPCNRNT